MEGLSGLKEELNLIDASNDESIYYLISMDRVHLWAVFNSYLTLHVPSLNVNS